MKSLVAVLIVVVASTTAWVWFMHRPEREQTQVVHIDTASASDRHADAGVVLPDTNAETDLARDAALEDPARSDSTRELRDGDADAASERRLMQSAAYVEKRRALVRLTMSGRYPDIARVLELSPATTERLLNVLADYRARYGRPSDNQTVEKSSSGPGERELAKQEREFALQSSVTETIGQAKMARYEEYMGSLYERYETRGLQFELMNSPDPLEFDDAERVIRAMYEERQQVERELTGIHGASDENDTYPPEFVVGGKKVAGLAAGTNERIFAAGARHLSPAQAEYFRRSLDDVDELNRLSEEIRRIRKGAKLDGY